MFTALLNVRLCCVQNGCDISCITTVSAAKVPSSKAFCSIFRKHFLDMSPILWVYECMVLLLKNIFKRRKIHGNGIVFKICFVLKLLICDWALFSLISTKWMLMVMIFQWPFVAQRNDYQRAASICWRMVWTSSYGWEWAHSMTLSRASLMCNRLARLTLEWWVSD